MHHDSHHLKQKKLEDFTVLHDPMHMLYGVILLNI